MPLRPSHDDRRLSFQGAVSCERTAAWTRPWRLPFDALALFPPAELQGRAAMSAGVRLAFVTDATSLRVRLEPQPEPGRLDLACDGEIVASHDLAGTEVAVFGDLPPGEKRVEMWLPQYREFRLRGLELHGATLRPFHDPRPRWVTYGSSITQCAEAASPSETWPAIVARTRGYHLTCLGYAGQCHLEPMLARLIRDLPTQFISVCPGINVYGSASLNARTLRPTLIGFLKTIRDGHPRTPLLVLSPILSPPRERVPNAVGLSLEAVRAEVAAAVTALQARGDPNLYLIDGLELFGPELAHLLPDDLHPNAEGYRRIAQNLLAHPVFLAAASGVTKEGALKGSVA